ncbi:hypothetical protein DSO57_1022761 [Entomophthora muscae]|uniref:Uncharacterized protein n=1 Tax=Entomophthora muscae TaxID=34485 RepID=A0ACC2SFT9_9FUNG|nr:hypothetical protein DSO57_1022761 [Entomophthora muscae]
MQFNLVSVVLFAVSTSALGYSRPAASYPRPDKVDSSVYSAPSSQVAPPVEAQPPAPPVVTMPPAKATPPTPPVEVAPPAKATPPTPPVVTTTPAKATPPTPPVEVAPPAPPIKTAPPVETTPPAKATPPTPRVEVAPPAALVETAPPVSKAPTAGAASRVYANGIITDNGVPSDAFVISNIILTPAVPVAGKPLDVHLIGELKSTIDQGSKTYIKATFEGASVMDADLDICQLAKDRKFKHQCPSKPQDFDVHHTIKIPAYAPKGVYNFNAYGFNQDNQRIFNISIYHASKGEGEKY